MDIFCDAFSLTRIKKEQLRTRDVKTYSCDDVYDVHDALLHQNDEKSIASVQSLCERFLSSVGSAFVFL